MDFKWSPKRDNERNEMKAMLQHLCDMVNEIKLILAKNQM